MADKEKIDELKNYFKKLQRIISYEHEFDFLGYRLVKKSKIDDILCCIIPTFPEAYKKIMKQKEGKKLGSVLAYELLYKAIKQKFIFNSNVYGVIYENAIKYINSILRDIDKDIEHAEKHVL